MQHDFVQSNKTFVVQASSIKHKMCWNSSRANVNDDAIALSHPMVALSGPNLGALQYAMCRRDVEKGLRTLGIGGSQGVAWTAECS